VNAHGKGDNIMAEEDRIIYLANIISVSRADGNFDSHEQKALQGICRSIGATETDLEKAMQAADGDDYLVTPVGRFSDKVRNLEDMVFIALSDGQLPESEKKRIRSFAKAIKVTQEQISEIVSEAKDRLQPETPLLTCPACEEKIQRDSNFCAYCGAKIA
jgi:uncharacterized tellurite resistance protein B-like protein